MVSGDRADKTLNCDGSSLESGRLKMKEGLHKPVGGKARRGRVGKQFERG